MIFLNVIVFVNERHENRSVTSFSFLWRFVDWEMPDAGLSKSRPASHLREACMSAG